MTEVFGVSIPGDPAPTTINIPTGADGPRGTILVARFHITAGSLSRILFHQSRPTTSRPSDLSESDSTVVLGMDSTEIPLYGRKEQSALAVRLRVWQGPQRRGLGRTLAECAPTVAARRSASRDVAVSTAVPTFFKDTINAVASAHPNPQLVVRALYSSCPSSPRPLAHFYTVQLVYPAASLKDFLRAFMPTLMMLALTCL
jgi:hypothetical protein